MLVCGCRMFVIDLNPFALAFIERFTEKYLRGSTQHSISFTVAWEKYFDQIGAANEEVEKVIFLTKKTALVLVILLPILCHCCC